MAVTRRLAYEAREGRTVGTLTPAGLEILNAELVDVLGDRADWLKLLRESELIRVGEDGCAVAPFFTADGLNKGLGSHFSGQSSKGGVYSGVTRRRRKIDKESQELALDLSPEVGGYHDHDGRSLASSEVSELIKVIKSLDNCFDYQRPSGASAYPKELVARASYFSTNYGHMQIEWGRKRHTKPALDVLIYFLMDHVHEPDTPKTTEQTLALVDVLMKRAQAFARTRIKAA